jgi:hypothetical protein
MTAMIAQFLCVNRCEKCFTYVLICSFHCISSVLVKIVERLECNCTLQATCGNPFQQLDFLNTKEILYLNLVYNKTTRNDIFELI